MSDSTERKSWSQRLGGFIDDVVDAVSPNWSLQRSAARELKAAIPGWRENTRLISRGGRSPRESQFINNDKALQSDRRSLADRVDEIVEESFIADTIVNVTASAMVGTGIVPRSLDSLYGKHIDRHFNRWSKTAFINHMTFWAGQVESCRDAFKFGDTAWLQLSDGRLQHIPSRTIQAPTGGLMECDRKDGFRHDDGVVTDAAGRYVAFYVSTKGGSRRYPARFVNFYVFRRKRSNDIRGWPAFENQFHLIHQVDRYIEATTVSARVAACVSLVLKKKAPFGMLSGLPSAPGKDDKIEKRLKLQPGGTIVINPDEDIVPFEPKQPTQQYAEVIRTNLRLIGMRDRIPLEVLFLDFSVGSFSSIKAALSLWGDAITFHQAIFVDGTLTRFFEWWVAAELQTGHLVLPGDDVVDAEHTWRPPAKKYFDPTVDVNADAIQVDTGIKTFAQWCDERNLDWREQIDEIATVNAYAAARGVVLSGSMNTRAPIGVPTNNTMPTQGT